MEDHPMTCSTYKDPEICNSKENCTWVSGAKRSYCRKTKKNIHEKDLDEKKNIKRKRCPNGTRRNKKGDCVKITQSVKDTPNISLPDTDTVSKTVVSETVVPDDNEDNVVVPDGVVPDGVVPDQKVSHKTIDIPDSLVSSLSEMEELDLGDVTVSEKNTTSSSKSDSIHEFKEYYDKLNRLSVSSEQDKYTYLYPNLDDKNFNIKIAERREFYETKYDGSIKPIEEEAEKLCNKEFELAPHQMFVRNFLSFQTPYNSMLLYHGLGSGKTCSAIGVGEEMRDYLKQIGDTKRIIVVASPNVQENFKVQLFDERKLKLIDGLWNIRSCTGNKYLKEINPMNMKGLSRVNVIRQINRIIRSSYVFMGYIQFANYISKKAQVDPSIESTKRTLIKKRNLNKHFNNRLIIIDEVHNIRITDDNSNKKVAVELMRLVSIVTNLRLLLLSATPLYNTYKEVIWLINLMNVNDNRPEIKERDIFNSDGTFRTDSDGDEVGKQLLERKATGYISFVRGENPYTFPFRIWPSMFSPENTYKTKQQPDYQLNGKKIIQPLEHLSIYLTEIGTYQAKGYAYILNALKDSLKKNIGDENQGIESINFKNMDKFGYTMLQKPLEGLNIIYPDVRLDKIDFTIFQDIYKNDIDEAEVEDVVDRDEIDDEDERKDGYSTFVDETKAVADTADTADHVDAVADDTSDGDVRNIDIVEERDETDDDDDTLLEDLQREEPIDINVLSNDLVSGGQKSNDSNNEYSDDDNDDDEDDTDDNSDDEKSKLLDSSNKTKILDEKLINEKTTNLSNLAKSLVGKSGLDRIMKYKRGSATTQRTDFEYKTNKYDRIFSPDNIGKYSGKIKAITDAIMKSTGVVLVYSQYIDGGLVPIALALEELGFIRAGKLKPLFKKKPTETIDAKTFQTRKDMMNSQDFTPASYAMITGDKTLSPDNTIEVKELTNQQNKEGSAIKVVLISQAGSEGLDFKFIRQVHILDPWYNMNRIEQIIGRAVRTCSHKDLPFISRNVEIFLYGTILENNKIEAADIYIYRHAERKSVNIGRVSRVLKQCATDCLLNYEQMGFSIESMNQTVKQELSDGKIISYKVGDRPYSSLCDYMESCQYQCTPNKDISEKDINDNTYTETFILMTAERIIRRIKLLFRERFVYKKSELIKHINAIKSYPLTQINAALHQLVDDKSEYVSDKYGRLGTIVNIGDLYLYQPIELTNTSTSIFDRSHPIPYKRKYIEINSAILKKKNLLENTFGSDKPKPSTNSVDIFKEIIRVIIDKYETGYQENVVIRGEKNWYKYSGSIIMELNKIGLSQEILSKVLLHHIIEELSPEKVIILLQHIDDNSVIDSLKTNLSSGKIIIEIKEYFTEKYIIEDDLIAFLLSDPDSSPPWKIYVNDKTNTEGWHSAKKTELLKLDSVIKKSISLEKNIVPKFDSFIGFMSKIKTNDDLVFKVKDTKKPRNKGAICDQSARNIAEKLLKDILESAGNTHNIANMKEKKRVQICILQELFLRYYNLTRHNDKIWFITPTEAIILKF